MDWILMPERMGAAAALVLAYAGLCAAITRKVRRDRRAKQAQDAELQSWHSAEGTAAAGDEKPRLPAILVIYASQTGQAEALARGQAQRLQRQGLGVRLLPVEQLSAELLAQYSRSLWLLSTTGEGDAPDQALSFVRGLLAVPPGGAAQVDLAAHQSLVLALGDRDYAQFCAFGLQVHSWLQACGASSEVVCVDKLHPATLQAWQQRVEHLLPKRSQPQEESDKSGEVFRPQRSSVPMVLSQRKLLNPGSPGEPLYWLQWLPHSGNPQDLPDWQSGDLVSLSVPADLQRPRDYSIASTPADGCLQMLVRLSRREDGSPGLASGWLCQGMAVGDSLALTVRVHPGFRLGANAQRPLVLIGNGSGLAGLLSHQRARVQQGLGDQWLIFGERSPAHDAIYAGQLQSWLQQGQLARLDRAWSRHGSQSCYVQDLLHRHADVLQQWVQRGAAIYVCGSRKGMGHGVQQALQAILGDALLQALQAEGRYRRDVY